jgi:ubiquitin thioesterase OTU1
MKKDVAFSIRSPSGQTRVSLPADNLSVAALKLAIEKATSIPVARQELRAGYPPVLLGETDELAKQGGSVLVSVVAPLGGGGTVGHVVPVGGGSSGSALSSASRMVRRVVPADNSCLFSCFAYCLMSRSRTIESARQMRGVVVQELLRQGELYSEVVLGKAPKDYVAWITGDNAWGGAIELGVLAQHFGVQVAVWDVQSKRMDLYEPEDRAAKRMYLLYDGLHYDPFALAAAEGAPEAQDECMFAQEDAAAREGAQQLTAKLHEAHAFTDTTKFSLRCLVCGAGLAGEGDAMKHAQGTKPPHTNFAEYKT